MTFRHTICRALLLALACGFCVPAGAQTISDEEVKLALIYKIARFVTWPVTPDQPGTPFRLCLAEDTIFDLAEDRFAGRRIRDRDIEVLLLRDSQRELSARCVVFYLARVEVVYE